MTPLLAACENGNTDIAKLLVENNADINVRNEFQVTTQVIH